MSKRTPGTDAIYRALAILREHFPAGFIIVPGGTSPRVRQWGDKSFCRGMAGDFRELCGFDRDPEDVTPPDEADAG